MKIKITMKDPDGFYDSVNDAVSDQITKEFPTISERERELLIEERFKKTKEITSKWFEYSEYLSVEIDTDTKTITVLEA